MSDAKEGTDDVFGVEKRRKEGTKGGGKKGGGKKERF